jgi:hypothetical protein
VTTCDCVTTDVQAVGLLPSTLTIEYDARFMRIGKSSGKAVAWRNNEATEKITAVGLRSILNV